MAVFNFAYNFPHLLQQKFVCIAVCNDIQNSKKNILLKIHIFTFIFHMSIHWILEKILCSSISTNTILSRTAQIVVKNFVLKSHSSILWCRWWHDTNFTLVGILSQCRNVSHCGSPIYESSYKKFITRLSALELSFFWIRFIHSCSCQRPIQKFPKFLVLWRVDLSQFWLTVPWVHGPIETKQQMSPIFGWHGMFTYTASKKSSHTY